MKAMIKLHKHYGIKLLSFRDLIFGVAIFGVAIYQMTQNTMQQNLISIGIIAAVLLVFYFLALRKWFKFDKEVVEQLEKKESENS